MLLMIVSMVDSPEDKIKVEMLYNKYDRLMYYTAGKILSQHEDIEDAVMEAWVRIIRNLDKISDISSPKTLSYTVIIVERTSIDIYNKKYKQMERELPISEHENSPFFVTNDHKIREFEIYEDIRTIPKELSDVLILYYLQDMKVKEIAGSLGISEDAVYKRLQKGRKELEKRWTND